MANFYTQAPKKAFWKTAVAESSPFWMEGLYTRKWKIGSNERIATAGSCFAQHISNHLRLNSFYTLDYEVAPTGLPASRHKDFGYSMYSARYGNIYTVQQLLQLALEVSGDFEPADLVWESNGRFHDALRPSVEPDGLDSRQEVLCHRRHHIARLRALFQDMDILIFTLGLTEAWTHRETGTVYPTAPGTIAGSFDPKVHQFKNYNFQEIIDALNRFQEVVAGIRGNQPRLKIILTVSPVPLTATASRKHVLQASTYSKAVLRAAAGQVSTNQQNIDYFPSYEIITNLNSRGAFYEANLRSVRNEAVEVVMRHFFAEHVPPKTGKVSAKHDVEGSALYDQSEPKCEEALLEEFAR